jgi:hypothetical protein
MEDCGLHASSHCYVLTQTVSVVGSLVASDVPSEQGIDIEGCFVNRES